MRRMRANVFAYIAFAKMRIGFIVKIFFEACMRIIKYVDYYLYTLYIGTICRYRK